MDVQIIFRSLQNTRYHPLLSLMPFLVIEGVFKFFRRFSRIGVFRKHGITILYYIQGANTEFWVKPI